MRLGGDHHRQVRRVAPATTESVGDEGAQVPVQVRENRSVAS